MTWREDTGGDRGRRRTARAGNAANGIRSPSMLIRRLIRRGVLLPAWLVAAACSNSNEATPNAPDASPPPLDASSSPTDATAESSLPIVYLSEAAAAPPPGPVNCGSKTCNPPAGGGALPLGACCLPDNSCGGFPDLSALGMGLPGLGAAPSGGDAGAGCLDLSKGTPDPSCPGQSVMGMSLPGCCTNAGICALDLSVGGLGCNPLSALGPLASLGGVSTPMDAGPPQTCGGGDAGVIAPVGDASRDAVADASSD